MNKLKSSEVLGIVSDFVSQDGTIQENTQKLYEVSKEVLAGSVAHQLSREQHAEESPIGAILELGKFHVIDAAREVNAHERVIDEQVASIRRRVPDSKQEAFDSVYTEALAAKERSLRGLKAAGFMHGHLMCTENGNIVATNADSKYAQFATLSQELYSGSDVDGEESQASSVAGELLNDKNNDLQKEEPEEPIRGGRTTGEHFGDGLQHEVDIEIDLENVVRSKKADNKENSKWKPRVLRMLGVIGVGLSSSHGLIVKDQYISTPTQPGMVTENPFTAKYQQALSSVTPEASSTATPTPTSTETPTDTATVVPTATVGKTDKHGYPKGGIQEKGTPTIFTAAPSPTELIGTVVAEPVQEKHPSQKVVNNQTHKPSGPYAYETSNHHKVHKTVNHATSSSHTAVDTGTTTFRLAPNKLLWTQEEAMVDKASPLASSQVKTEATIDLVHMSMALNPANYDYSRLPATVLRIPDIKVTQRVVAAEANTHKSPEIKQELAYAKSSRRNAWKMVARFFGIKR